MPEISLLEPTVLRGVIEQLTAPEQMVMLNRLPRTPWPYPNVTWDVIKGSRMVAKPNVPNAEAHIVPKLGRTQASAAFVYLREKKVFEPTTIYWIRQPGSLAGRNAEAAVMREVTDLNQRFDNFMEWCCWRAMSGTLTLDYEDVQTVVDYRIPSSHKPSPGVSWATATPQQIRNDVTAWKRLINRDARVGAREAFGTAITIDRVVNAFASSTTLLTDRMREAYYQGNALPGFQGLDWIVVESVFDTDAGTSTLFVPDDALYIVNATDNRPIELFEGPSADDEAPDGHTGKFSKVWKEKDPSARQFLLEWHALPIITRPEQFVYVADVAP